LRVVMLTFYALTVTSKKIILIFKKSTKLNFKTKSTTIFIFRSLETSTRA
jgi:hypothetical protein